ncbi:MAG: M23 family metallopeptidase [Casimicrobium sp.]
MKPTAATWIWGSALAWCVLFLFVAAVANELSSKSAAAGPVAPVTQSGARSVLVARSKQPADAGASPSPSVAVASGATDDVLRLRARGLTLPVSAKSAAQLTDSYTQRRSSGTTHEALDIMAPRGTPVLAVEEGRVVKLFSSKQGGITLYQFDTDATYVYYYAHLDRYAEGILEGDTVLKGQIIGYVGSTGNAAPDAPHLHFAISRLGPERQWWRGTPINPFLIWRNAQP